MRILAALLLAATVTAAPLRAQASSDSTAIIALIDKLFLGMQNRDTAAMRSTFAPDARMMRLTQQQQLSFSPIDGWLASAARPQASGPVRERTWGHEVRVDGNIAQAWMQYDLHIGERFSHCGVDAFDLVKLGGDWKIVSVMDTRRTTGCTQPPADRR